MPTGDAKSGAISVPVGVVPPWTGQGPYKTEGEAGQCCSWSVQCGTASYTIGRNVYWSIRNATGPEPGYSVQNGEYVSLVSGPFESPTLGSCAYGASVTVPDNLISSGISTITWGLGLLGANLYRELVSINGIPFTGRQMTYFDGYVSINSGSLYMGWTNPPRQNQDTRVLDFTKVFNSVVDPFENTSLRCSFDLFIKVV